jgi:ABC-type transporter Mla subunit MlaD
MRRIFPTLLLLIALGGAAYGAYALTAGRQDTGKRYTVELDNAFGIVEGADLKVAGVRAGKITGMRVEPKSHRALVDFEITKNGFGSLRDDVFCESRPQSLIGEYFVDCNPGTGSRTLEEGATIPVAQTASTIPVDLINNIMRKPYRERLGIIVNELGTGVAGRSKDLNDAIRRASPALRETDKVLAKLANQNQILQRLVADADVVIGDLAGNRKDVARWVVETKETATASAERRGDIAASLNRLPGFLRELRPTMTQLGATSEAQTPSLANLNASADQLTRFLENLKPFSESSQVNLRSLAAAARKGRPAVKAARPMVDELAAATKNAPELANNSAIVLEHLDDRKNAVEKDPRSPGGQGYTGFEAIMSWLFDNSMAINTFDQNGYMLKVNLFHSECSEYQNLESLKEHMKEDPGFFQRCASILGPNLPGITQPDPTFTGAQHQEKHGPHSARRTEARKPDRPAAADAPRREVDRGREKLTEAEKQARQQAREMVKRLEETLGIDLPDAAFVLPQLPGGVAPDTGVQVPETGLGLGPSDAQANQLLDYLFAP